MDIDFSCYALGRSVGSIIREFANFFTSAIRITLGVVGMMVSTYWHSFNIDRTDNELGNNRGEC